jgi:hypothetical protein
VPRWLFDLRLPRKSVLAITSSKSHEQVLSEKLISVLFN